MTAAERLQNGLSCLGIMILLLAIYVILRPKKKK